MIWYAIVVALILHLDTSDLTETCYPEARTKHIQLWTDTKFSPTMFFILKYTSIILILGIDLKYICI